MKQDIILIAISVVFLCAITSCATTEKATNKTETTTVSKQTTTKPVAEVKTEEDKEYERSINQMEGNVTKEVFNEDKKAILQKIDELDVIMKDYDYAKWITYVDAESLDYWTNRVNLHKASKRLPVKGLQLESLQDYFKFVFVQSRVGRKIDEIRYISGTSVKAVQVREEQDIVYYYFHKQDGDWKLHLPPLED